jgi:hypothetical protein
MKLIPAQIYFPGLQHGNLNIPLRKIAAAPIEAVSILGAPPASRAMAIGLQRNWKSGSVR